MKKTKIFVSHGGLNSCKEAIMSLTPTILIPQGADQFIGAQNMEKLNLGLSLFKPDPN